MLRHGTQNLLDTIIVSSSLFFEIENDANNAIISGPIIDLYDVAFIKCNAKSHAYSVTTANKLFSTITFFEHSGGITSNISPSRIRVHSLASLDIKSDQCITLPKANMEISQVNFTNNVCKQVCLLNEGPSCLDSRFISFIENNCFVCANIEADDNGTNTNSHFQFIRNKCSGYLFTTWRANCYCDWFFFIENNITNCIHANNNIIFFTNTFSTSEMVVEEGSTSGTVSITQMHTELPFPAVVRKLQTRREKKMKLTLLVAFLNSLIF